MQKMKLPYFRQSTPYSCGPAALRSLFAYYGKHCSEKDIAQKAGTRRTIGTPRIGMIRAARKYGFRVSQGRGGTIDILSDCLARAQYPIVRFVEPEGDEHYGIVVTIEKMHIEIQDPYHGANMRYTIRDFNARWYDGSCGGWWMSVYKSQ